MQGILSFASRMRNTAITVVGAFCVVSVSGFSTAAHALERDAQKVPVHEYVLDNGLKVLVKQDKRAPIAAVMLWYKVGSSYEHGGITGVSHVLEHMMFKGTEKYPTGEFNRIIAENGAQDNAFTSKDYTAYYQVIASDRIEVSMELEADRMRGLTLPPAEFKKELEVVKEERRWRTEDKPNSLTYEQFMATAFMSSPYHNPVIGWMSDLESMEVEDLRAWYERWYAPNNATLVVVGDVEPDAIHAMAKKYYGDIKPSDTIVPPKPQIETPQTGKRMITVKAPAELPYVMMGYKVPGVLSAEEKWEPYALEVLSSILDGGSSSRMSREMIRGKEIAASASAWYSGYGRLPNLFVMSGVPAKDVELQVVKDALQEQLERLKTDLVDEKELQRVKAQVIAEEVYERDSVQHMATILGSLETVGLGHKLMDSYVDNILAVTPEQIQAVAKKYFIEDTLTIAELDPQPIDPNKPKQSRRFTR